MFFLFVFFWLLGPRLGSWCGGRKILRDYCLIETRCSRVCVFVCMCVCVKESSAGSRGRVCAVETGSHLRSTESTWSHRWVLFNWRVITHGGPLPLDL